MIVSNEKISPLISVIIPVFNTERYLFVCLDSVYKQTYPYFQVIIVNDASTDNSLKIIQEFIAKDRRFSLINLKKNVGRCVARNKALERIGGDFVTFVDSDDVLDKNYLKNLLDTAISNNADIVVCNYQLINQNSFKSNVPETKEIQITDAYTFFKSVFSLKLDKQLVTGGYLWNKLINKRVIAGVRFPETKGGEDELFFFLLKKNINVVVFIPQILYYYREREDSVTQSTQEGSFIARLVESRFGLLEFCEDESQIMFAHSSCIQVCIAFIISTILSRNVSSKDISFCLPYCKQALIWERQGQYLPILPRKLSRFKLLLNLAKKPNYWFLLFFLANKIHFYKLWQLLKYFR